MQTGQGSADRRHCPAVERVGGFNKLTNGKAYLVFKQSQRRHWDYKYPGGAFPRGGQDYF